VKTHDGVHGDAMVESQLTTFLPDATCHSVRDEVTADVEGTTRRLASIRTYDRKANGTFSDSRVTCQIHS
jgi:hypothetical protein